MLPYTLEEFTHSQKPKLTCWHDNTCLNKNSPPFFLLSRHIITPTNFIKIFRTATYKRIEKRYCYLTQLLSAKLQKHNQYIIFFDIVWTQSFDSNAKIISFCIIKRFIIIIQRDNLKSFHLKRVLSSAARREKNINIRKPSVNDYRTPTIRQSWREISSLNQYCAGKDKKRWNKRLTPVHR